MRKFSFKGPYAAVQGLRKVTILMLFLLNKASLLIFPGVVVVRIHENNDALEKGMFPTIQLITIFRFDLPRLVTEKNSVTEQSPNSVTEQSPISVTEQNSIPAAEQKKRKSYLTQYKLSFQ